MMDFFRGKVLHVNEADRRLLARIVNEARTFLEGRLDDPYQTSLTVRSDAPPGAAQIIRTCLEQFLIGLARRYRKDSVQTVQKDIRSFIPDKTTTENADEEMFSQIAAYLSDNLSSHITIEKICSDNLIGRSRLQKLFQEKCGLGIIEYFSHMKIDAAKQLIRNEQMNFTQISENLGYSSIHYFSRQFKKLTGMTPSEYASSIKAMADRNMEQGGKGSRKKSHTHSRQAESRRGK